LTSNYINDRVLPKASQKHEFHRKGGLNIEIGEDK